MRKKRFISFLIALLLIWDLGPKGVCPLYADNAAWPSNVLDTRISFEVGDAEIGGVLKALAEAFDLNIVVGENVKGQVTLSLKDVRLEDALDLILQSSGSYYTVRDNIIMIKAPDQNLVAEVVPIRFAKASQIQSSVSALVSGEGSVSVAEGDNRLILKETPQRLQSILKEIEKLDHPPHQILIEARMIEVEDTDLRAFGIQWNSNVNLAGSTDGKGPLGTRTFQPAGAGSTTTTTTSEPSGNFLLNLQETSADLTGGQLVYGLTWQRLHASATIDALIRTNRAHILASPTIAAMDGEEAKIIIGEKFPFRENTLTAVGTTETTRFVDIGTALRVVPRVINNDDIMMEIHPEVSSLNESLAAGPRINTREATTKIMVKNGQTIVIAGLIQHEKTVIRQRVPFLGNLPVLGLAFRNKSTDFVTKELAVFITPYILRPLEGEAGEPVIDVFSAERFYNRAIRLMEEFGIESLGKMESQRYSEAIANFKSIIRNFGESEIADDALYQLGRLYDEKMGKPKLAAEVWNQLIVQFPDSPYVTDEFSEKLANARKQAEGKIKKKTRFRASFLHE